MHRPHRTTSACQNAAVALLRVGDGGVYHDRDDGVDNGQKQQEEEPRDDVLQSDGNDDHFQSAMRRLEQTPSPTSKGLYRFFCPLCMCYLQGECGTTVSPSWGG
jgi:hypothetical protein